MKILFVCLGNICRSPAAEAVMAGKLEKLGISAKYQIDSAGITDFHQGHEADRRMRHHAQTRGYEITSLSRPVRIEDFSNFDLILAMDKRNYRDLMELCPRDPLRERVKMMGDYCQKIDSLEVPDPYYGGDEGFEFVMDMLEDAVEGLIGALESPKKE